MEPKSVDELIAESRTAALRLRGEQLAEPEIRVERGRVFFCEPPGPPTPGPAAPTNVPSAPARR